MDAIRVSRFNFRIRPAMAFVAAALLAGCVDFRERTYAPIEVVLDQRNVLRISTYPSWFPSETSDIPFLKKTVRTPESVYFQVYVRDAKTRAGPNPNIQSIKINSFSYQVPGRAPVVLIENYDDYFWMQDNSGDNNAQTTPVPWVQGQRMTVAVSLVLNGKAHELKRDMIAVERSSSGSLIAHEFLR